jgi:hypothetical protein
MPDYRPRSDVCSTSLRGALAPAENRQAELF